MAIASTELEGKGLAVLIAQCTNDTVEVALDRLQGPLKNPCLRYLISAHQATLYGALQGDDPFLAYKAWAELHSVMAFGPNFQTIDLSKPIQLIGTDKDLLSKFNAVGIAMTNRDLTSARQGLDNIPLPRGSECDAGKYEGYTHEVLFPISSMADHLRHLIPSSNTEMRAHKRERACFELTSEIGRMIDGYHLGNRRAIMVATRRIMDAKDKLLKPETPLEKIKHSLVSIFT